MIELLFLLGFTLHNIEEALWLPNWSSQAGRYHPVVSENEFRFAVIMITALGYLITFQYFIWGSSFEWSRLMYRAFLIMMVLNAFVPHLAATIALKKYAPGTLTGFMLNVPIGSYLVYHGVTRNDEIPMLIIATIATVVIFLMLIRLFFTVGRKLIT